MSEAAFVLPQDTQIQQELVLQSKHFTERWMWVQATSRYSWWDALRARPLRIPTNELIHMHGWRRFICLELKGHPGEEIWVRGSTWDSAPGRPVPESFGDFRHLTHKMLLDVLFLLLSPATLSFGLFYLFMVQNPLQSWSSLCPQPLQEAFNIYLQIAATLVATPVLSYSYYRVLRRFKFLSYDVRRVYSMTVAALAVISIAGMAWLVLDHESRDTLHKIQNSCRKP
jgi:hypothetical protein